MRLQPRARRIAPRRHLMHPGRDLAPRLQVGLQPGRRPMQPGRHCTPPGRHSTLPQARLFVDVAPDEEAQAQAESEAAQAAVQQTACAAATVRLQEQWTKQSAAHADAKEQLGRLRAQAAALKAQLRRCGGLYPGLWRAWENAVCVQAAAGAGAEEGEAKGGAEGVAGGGAEGADARTLTRRRSAWESARDFLARKGASRLGLMAAGAADESETEDEVFVARVAVALGSLGQMQAGVLARLQAVARDLGRWVGPRGRGVVTLGGASARCATPTAWLGRRASGGCFTHSFS